MQQIIVTTLYLLSIFIPLIFTTINSELFEFPKFILLLSGTLVITSAWAVHIYQTRDFKIFKPSIITYGVLAILVTQILATIFSIHPYTSFWGYYSRFHGGLLTTICYTIIYFAVVKWMNTKSTLKLIKISVITAIIIALYAIAERLGIDKNFWIQDVQNRPFSTLGQPNWLAAYLLPNIFLSLYLSFTSKRKKPTLISLISFVILFIVILLTKSRSGFLAFILSAATYLFLLSKQFTFDKIKKSTIPYALLILSVVILIGTPYSPSLFSYLTRRLPVNNLAPQQGTQLESGGTESGDIRKIVWTGALNLIKKHPLLGTGPETFAYTYYWERPVAHNMTSEWDFLYNKAHNEYLNTAAGAGLLGLFAYLYFHYAVLATSLTTIPKSKKIDQDHDHNLRQIYPVLGASLVAFTITNFFGFSVIPVYLLMIFLSAFPSTVSNDQSTLSPLDIPPSTFPILILALIYPLRLFLADYYYAKGKVTNSLVLLSQARDIRPGLDLFRSQLGETYATSGQKDLALQELDQNRQLNPYHLNFYKSRAKIYLTLASLDPSYHLQAAKELEAARLLAPTDPKLAYNLGLVYTRLDKAEAAAAQLRDAIALKPNYPEPYYALTLLYEQTKQTDKVAPLLESAKSNLSTYSSQLKEKIEKYILDKNSPI
jgi:O-antigen ligase/Tfp pilus assembly protein PilF